MSKAFKIAVIPGDGIGKEVMPEGLRVLNSAARRFGIALEPTTIEWASCDYYLKTGAMMPADGMEQLARSESILLGAVFLQERLEVRHFAGMALIGLGLLVIDGRLGRLDRDPWDSGGVLVETHAGRGTGRADEIGRRDDLGRCLGGALASAKREF